MDRPELRAWRTLPPLERLAAFKRLAPAEAMRFFGLLSYEEKYFLFCGYDRNSIAPLLEKGERGFHHLGKKEYEEMLSQLSEGRPA